jgi:hypothetical protein
MELEPASAGPVAEMESRARRIADDLLIIASPRNSIEAFSMTTQF